MHFAKPHLRHTRLKTYEYHSRVTGVKTTIDRQQSMEHHLEDALLSRRPKGFGSTGQRKSFRNQPVDLDATGREQPYRRLEPAATRTYQCDFVDDCRSGVDFHKAMHGGLHDYRSPRLAERDCGPQTFGGAGRIHHHWPSSFWHRFPKQLRGDAVAFYQVKLFTVAADNMDPRPTPPQHLRDKQAELSVSQHCDWRARQDSNLIENLARSCNWLDKHGLLVRNRGWY